MLPLSWLVVTFGFLTMVAAGCGLIFRAAFRVYIAGSNIDEAGPKIEKLLRRGFSITSDIVGEFVNTERGIIAAMKEYADHMTVLWFWQIIFPKLIVSLAVKPSRLGLEIEEDMFRGNLEKLLGLARGNDVFVWVDAEKKRDREKVVEAVMLMRSRGYENVGLALQSVHSDAKTILDRLLKSGTPFRLVKGAYPDGDLKRRSEINENFKDIFWSALYHYCNNMPSDNRYPKIAVATHDTELVDYALRFERDAELSKLIQFQMLYGVRTKLQKETVEAGKKILVYVPWGSDARGYFLRRCLEGIKPSVLLLFVRNIFEAVRFQKETL